MSQSDFGVIDPNTKSGTQLAVDLNGFRDAVNSGHSGSTRPAYLPAGGHWVRIVSSTQWDLVFYDGSVDYTLRSVNPTTGQKIGIPAADLADKQTSANDNTTGRLLVNPAYGLGTTGALSLPSGPTANRPPSPAQFDSRGNSTTGAPEWWSGSAWVPFSGIDYLNTTRIDVASATTVDLTSLAPNTRHINLTGTVSVTGFTVTAGQTYFVRFNGATLTNNANIVTQSGANINTVAGDTCIIRATAANVVELLAYTPFAYTILREYTSAEQTITLGAVTILTHNLGANPKLATLSAICKTAELGYAVGDEIDVRLDANNNSGGASIGRNSTTLRLIVGASGIYAHNASGAIVFITPANWRLIARAWV